MGRRALVVAWACALVALGWPAAAGAEPVGEPQVLASGLEVPWEVLALPDGRTLVSERSARRIRVVEPDGRLRAAPAWSEPSALKVLGMDLHPGYATNRWVYVYVTYASGSRVLRLVDDGVGLRTDRVIFDRPIATDRNHDGGRIRFGPDGRLYVTTGDVHDPALPRDLSKLNGKVLRLQDDGSAPADNPFAGRRDDGRYVFSSGHRHPQGLAWDATGRLWVSEHGPTGERHAPPGERTGNDEVNLVVPGGDYGWPQSAGDVVAPGTRPPAWVAGEDAVAPGGLAFAPDGRLYVPMLAGRHLRVFEPRGDALVDLGSLFPGDRLRAASVLGCSLAFTTDRRDGPVDEVRTVAIAPCAAAPTGPLNPPPAPGTPPAGGPGVPSEVPRPSGGPGGVGATDRLLRRTVRALERLGLRGLAAGRPVTARVGGLAPGTLTVRVRHVPRGARSRTVAQAQVRVRGRSAVRVRLVTTRSARARLRRLRVAPLRVSASHRALGGGVTRSARTVRVGRRARAD